MKQVAILLASVLSLSGCGDPPPAPEATSTPRREPPPTASAETIARSVRAGRIWLATTQSDDGSWNCDPSGSVGLTGLAMLALLRDQAPRCQPAVRAGAAWLAKVQRRDGSFPVDRFEEQAMALWALASASEPAGAGPARAAAERGAAWIVRIQPEHGGFSPEGPAESDEADPAATLWVAFALTAADDVGLSLPPEALPRAVASLCLLRGRFPYTSVASLYGRALDGRPVDEPANETMVGALSPGSSHAKTVGDMTYTLFAAAAAHAVAGRLLDEYRRACLGPLCKAQHTAPRDREGNCIEGSWSPERHRGGRPRSRTALTAMAILCLTAHQWAGRPRDLRDLPAW